MTEHEKFGDWLRRTREARNLTQQELAERAGMSGQQISNIETGRTSRPQEATRRRLENALTLAADSTPDHAAGRAAPVDHSPGASLVLGRELGRGGYGTVYEARDTTLERRVAVKIMRSSGEAVMSAVSQAKALARADHPNVVIVHTVVQIKDPETSTLRDAIVMELLEGQKLSDRLKDGPALALAELKEIGFGLIAGLEHLHAKGLVHQDLHEDNVLLVGTRPKLIDPMHMTTLADLSGSAREGRIRRDITNLGALLDHLLRRSSIDNEHQTAFSSHADREMTLDLLRQHFETATSGHAGPPETALPENNNQPTIDKEMPKAARVEYRQQKQGLGRRGLVGIGVTIALLAGVGWFAWTHKVQQPDLRGKTDGGLAQTTVATDAASIHVVPSSPGDSGAHDNTSTCDAMRPPFFPCCDRSAAAVWTERRPPFDEFASNNFYLLSCARTPFHDGSQGPPWVCGVREKQCTNAPNRAGQCNDCVVYMAGLGKAAVWTARAALGTVYGPYEPSGARGIHPDGELTSESDGGPSAKSTDKGGR